MISSTAKQKPEGLVSVLWFPLSNPLYFSYLIFFSPYLFKLFSFLSPLFATTALLILSLLTTTANLIADEEDHQHFRYFQFDESEVYKIVFDTAADDTPTISPESDYLSDEEVVKEMTSSAPESQTQIQEKESIIKEDHHQSADTKVVIMDRHEEEDVMIISELLLSPVTATPKALLSPSLTDHDQPGFASPEWDDDFEEPVEKSTGVNDSPARENLGGSMRKEKEKEWRRTLACKLFEERHNGGGGEGMDSLWETYEAENDNRNQRNDNSATPKNDNKKKPSKMRRNSTKSSSMSSISGSVDGGGKKGITENGDQLSNNNNNDNGDYLYGGGGGDVDDDEDWDEDGTNGKLCCLQALKFSAGKMGKPNLLKFSKAFKGIGWFHTVAKHAKKRYY